MRFHLPLFLLATSPSRPPQGYFLYLEIIAQRIFSMYACIPWLHSLVIRVCM